MSFMKVENATVSTDNYGDFCLRLKLGKMNGVSPTRTEVKEMIVRCRKYGGRPLLRRDFPVSEEDWKNLARWVTGKTFDFKRYKTK